ncbi:MAG: methionine synthase [Oscillospiraceae bacterium]|nr:methionine synthase [Oscillospiraceae bacterium]
MTLTAIDKVQAFRYMGYTDENIPESIRTLTDACEKRLLEIINISLNFRIFDIEFADNGVLLCGSNFLMQGNDIKNHLSGCAKAALLCATLGTGTDKLINRLSISDMTESFITDALASAAIEQVCDKAEKQIKDRLPDMFMTWRYSPGYGDFPISQQQEFLAVTNASKNAGIHLSESGMLIPSKSVTAVTGLSEKPVAKKKQGCVSCNMYDRCSYRKRGVRCEF